VITPIRHDADGPAATKLPPLGDRGERRIIDKARRVECKQSARLHVTRRPPTPMDLSLATVGGVIFRLAEASQGLLDS
jgi:hypothetical protein